MVKYLKLFSPYIVDMTSSEPTNNLQITSKKEKIRLLFPYSEKDELKKLGAKWDNVNKYWYYPTLNGKLPENLQNYQQFDIAVEYDDREYFRPILKSMKWDKERKVWMVNKPDYEKFLTL